MKKLIITILLLMLTLSFLVAFTPDKDVAAEINKVRTDNGLTPLNRNPVLDGFAMYRLEKIGSTLVHTDFKKDFIQQVQSKTGGAYAIGEITAMSNICTNTYLDGVLVSSEPQQVSIDSYIQYWLNSPTHRAVIMYGGFTDIGYACEYRDGCYLVFVEFARKVK